MVQWALGPVQPSVQVSQCSLASPVTAGPFPVHVSGEPSATARIATAALPIASRQPTTPDGALMEVGRSVKVSRHPITLVPPPCVTRQPSSTMVTPGCEVRFPDMQVIA